MPLQRTESVEGERRREGHRPEELEKDGSPQAGHGSAGERGLGHSQVLRWRMLGPGPGAQTGDSRAKQIFFFFFFLQAPGKQSNFTAGEEKASKAKQCVDTRGPLTNSPDTPCSPDEGALSSGSGSRLLSAPARSPRLSGARACSAAVPCSPWGRPSTGTETVRLSSLFRLDSLLRSRIRRGCI